MPPASTATVPVARAASCAAASIPRANPDAITNPAAPKAAAISAAKRRPASEASRAPPIASAGRASSLRSPMAASRGGGVRERRQRGGVSDIAPDDELPAEASQLLLLALGLEGRNRREFSARRSRGAKMAERLVEGDSADARAAGEAQTGKAFLGIDLARQGT